MTGYGGEDERRKPYPGLPTTWLPEVINERDSVMRCRGLYVPTWMFLAGWLGVWGWQTSNRSAATAPT
jgi:hypothetical protein